MRVTVLDVRNQALVILESTNLSEAVNHVAKLVASSPSLVDELTIMFGEFGYLKGKELYRVCKREFQDQESFSTGRCQWRPDHALCARTRDSGC